MKIILTNSKINFNYQILDKYEAGIVLKGVEVKSIYLKNANISDSYVIFKKNEPYILNMNIQPYNFGNIYNVEPLRTRKLLLNKKEILFLIHKIKKENLTLIPSKMYWKNNKLKIEVCVCKGKKIHDKRHSIKEKDIKRLNAKKI